MAQVNRHRGEHNVHTLGIQGVYNIPQVALEMLIDCLHAGVLLRYAIVHKHLHALPLKVRLGIAALHFS